MRWWQPVPAPSIDQTQTIAKTFDGDGLDVKRVDTNVWFHTFPNNDSGTTTKTEYYVRSSVLSGETITELDQAGAKKVTHVYTGKGRLAEQRIINGTPGVYWRHEDLVTGSYGKIDINGQYGGYAENSPTAVEYDPLGGKIEPDAPQDETLNPAHLMQFKFAGDNNRSENGCMLNHSPVSCDLMMHVARVSGLTTLGGEIWQQNSTWRYTRYRRYDNESIEGNRRANAGEPYRLQGRFLDIQEGQPWYQSYFSLITVPGGVQTVYTNKNKDIRKAIEDADAILGGDNDCAKFFGKYGLKALAALDKLLRRGIVDGPGNKTTGIRMRAPEGLSPEEARGDSRVVDGKNIQDVVYRVFPIGTVNTNGPFFYPLSPARIGNYNPSSRESRVLQILHELAHMILVPDGSGGYKPLIPDDGGSGEANSGENTTKILEKCKTQIENLGKKK